MAFSAAWPHPARAGDALNSSDRTSDSSQSSDSRARTDVTVVPAVGGTTDIGFGLAEFAGITRVKKGADPYPWDLSSGGLVTFRDDGGTFVVPSA